MRQLDRFALLVLAHAELQVGVGELAEDAVGRVGHFALHGEQLFFARAERVRLVADQPLELQPKRLQRLGVDILLELLRRAATRISGRMKLAASAASVAACS